MIKKSIKYFFVFFSLAASGQAQLYLDWSKTIYTPKLSPLAGLEVYNIIEANTNRYLISGYSFENDSNGDGWIAYIDCKGDTIWTKKYGLVGENEKIRSISKVNDNSFILTGYSSDNGIDGVIREIDSLGNTLTFSNFGGSGNDALYDAIVYEEEIYAVGHTSSTDGDISESKGNRDIWVIKLDIDFNVLWSITLGGSMSEEAYSIEVSSDNNLFISGRTRSENGDILDFMGGFSDAIVSKISLDGSIIWTKTFGTDAVENFRGIEATQDGNLLAYGYSSSNQGNDFLIVKMTNDGEVIWERIESGPDYETPQDVIELNGHYYVLGSFTSESFLGLENLGVSDYVLIKYDQDGNRTGEFQYGGTGEDYGVSLISQGSDKLLLFGSTKSQDVHNIDSLSNNEVFYWILKLSESPIFRPVLTVENIESNSVSVSWSDSSGIDTYSLLIINEDDSIINSVPGNEFIVSNLNPSEYYNVQVNYTGYCEVDYFSNTLTVLTLPIAPLSINYEQISANSFSLSWTTVQNVDYYEIELAMDETFEDIIETIDSVSQNNYNYQSSAIGSSEIFVRIRSKNSTGYSSYSEPITVVILGLEVLKTIFRVFPNPGESWITVGVEGVLDFKEIEITSLSGKIQTIKVFSVSENEMKIDVSNLPKGIYIIRLITNGQTLSRKILLK